MILINGRKKQALYTGNEINGQPIADDPVAFYTMDNIVGSSLIDESGNGYHGTLINSPTQVEGRIGKALDFVPASTQYVNCGAAMGNALGTITAFSVSTWFKADTALSGPDGLFYVGTYGGVSHGLFTLFTYTADKLYFRMAEAAFDANVPIGDMSAYHHVVAIYTGTKGLLYLDNVKVVDSATGVPVSLALTGETIIGSSRSNSYTFDGQIEQVRIYDRALSESEIDALYRERVSPNLFVNGKPFN
ncbi:LamG domain-containing protein [bacterium]|nr:LamG domain-containing protein [bacterium]